ncbi:MAG: ankyrin repeat domain-containing protein [Chitinophagaceae bacterium]|nr:ankyrin repeat domain-containing protein [Chitinophagaceae bacterium]
MNRKSFLRNFSIGAGVLIAAPVSTIAQDATPAPLPADKVKEFIGAGHNNLAKVKTLLLEFPNLLYATWDWGGGDFETALEGAGHVGTKDVANFLIDQGARTNLFVLTMLGKTQIVKAYLNEYPQYLNARGPHGFTLLHHAQRGGEDAKELLDYLQSRGLKETRVKIG